MSLKQINKLWMKQRESALNIVTLQVHFRPIRFSNGPLEGKFVIITEVPSTYMQLIRSYLFMTGVYIKYRKMIRNISYQDSLTIFINCINVIGKYIIY